MAIDPLFITANSPIVNSKERAMSLKYHEIHVSTFSSRVDTENWGWQVVLEKPGHKTSFAERFLAAQH